MKISQYIVSLLILALSVSSCDLTVTPENNQSTSQYWKTKEDVEAVVAAGYCKIRDAQEYMMLWGEARGNGIYFSSNSYATSTAAQNLRNFDILANNTLAKWDKLYAIISMANSVIKYGPTVKDASLNENVLNSYLSEAYFQRALAYFYLVRIWKDVPYVTQPYVDDSQSYEIAKSSGDSILKSCLNDLKVALESAKSRYAETDASNPVYTKGRATKWSIYSLMADINLWLGNYNDCITECDAVINSGQVGLISGSTWFYNFCNASGNGNSNESIYEIQYSYDQNQTNSFYTWFYNSYYYISSYQLSLYDATDLRGLGASYTSDLKIWKYIGANNTATARGTTQYDQDWIIYRLADIYLMQAEAYTMLGGDDNMTKSLALVNKIRNRAGLANAPISSVKTDMMLTILQERQRELFCEGKNWFDLVRIGHRSDAGFKDLFISQVLQVASASNSAMIRSILQDSNSWYLPIHTDELTANSLLVQNPYYANLGN